MEKDLKDIKRIPAAPEYFNENTKRWYGHVVKLLLQTKALKDLDMIRVQQLAQELSCYEEMSKKIESFGYINKHDQVSGYVSVRNKAFQNISTIIKEFGMSWSARDKMKGRFQDVDPNQQSLMDQLFATQPGETKLRKVK